MISLCIVCLFLGTGALSSRTGGDPAFARISDVVYGRKAGTALTISV